MLDEPPLLGLSHVLFDEFDNEALFDYFRLSVVNLKMGFSLSVATSS